MGITAQPRYRTGGRTGMKFAPNFEQRCLIYAIGLTCSYFFTWLVGIIAIAMIDFFATVNGDIKT